MKKMIEEIARVLYLISFFIFLAIFLGIGLIYLLKWDSSFYDFIAFHMGVHGKTILIFLWIGIQIFLALPQIIINIRKGNKFKFKPKL